MRKNWGTLILSGLLVGALSFIFLLTTQKKYQIRTDYLIVQDQPLAQDFYTLSRSAQYLRKVLGEAIYSETVIKEIIQTRKVSSGFFPTDAKKRLDAWQKMIRIDQNSELSLLKVFVLADEQREGLRLSEALNEVITEKYALFFGENQPIAVRVISGPIIEENPSRKEIAMVVVGGFGIGIFLGFIFLYYRYGDSRREEYFEEGYAGKNRRSKSEANRSGKEYPHIKKSGAPSNLPYAKEDKELERLRRSVMEDER